MQLYAGRPADQWRGFTALDAGNSGEPVTWYDSARHHAAWRHHHRSDNGGHADAEHVGMRRERDNESGNARHDGTGQRHRRRGNAGRISTRLLTDMSRSSFARKFKETVDTSPMEHLRRWRMLRAGDRLANSSDPISVIARSLGYDSESAFSTAFKRALDCSPRRHSRGRNPTSPSKLTGPGTCVSGRQEPCKPKSTALRVRARITLRPSCQQIAEGAS
jgi:AraC-like DNA-binding protein